MSYWSVILQLIPKEQIAIYLLNLLTELSEKTNNKVDDEIVNNYKKILLVLGWLK